MRKCMTMILIICLTLSTVTFALLWTAEKGSKEDMKELAQAQASHSYRQFAIYQDSGETIRYWDGVASFLHLSKRIVPRFKVQTNQAINLFAMKFIGIWLVSRKGARPLLRILSK